MRASKLTITGLLTALLLAACGGGDPYVPGTGTTSGAPTTKGNFTSIVVFGTSPSDMGTYSPATSLAGNGSAPYFGGKFTTNGVDGKVYVEDLAARLGITLTAAEMGFDGAVVKCPAALVNAALASTCTNYAQGGARITDPNGVGHDPATGRGALTVPVVTQMDNHLTAFGTFSATDLILVEGGLNDLFTQMGIFGATATQIQQQAASGAITADQATQLLFAAQTTAQVAMKQAALELAAAVRSKILAHGGKYVAVATMPDLENTPWGLSAQLAPVRGVMIDLTHLYNLWLREGLVGQPVQILDFVDVFNTIVASPATYGFVNVTTPACDATKISGITGGRVADGSSLFCNSTTGVPYTGIRDGASTQTWLYADSVHPTSGGHRVLADMVVQQLTAFGWL